jgi:hypothetical protein
MPRNSTLNIFAIPCGRCPKISRNLARMEEESRLHRRFNVLLSMAISESILGSDGDGGGVKPSSEPLILWDHAEARSQIPDTPFRRTLEGRRGTVMEHTQEASRQVFISTAQASTGLLVRRRVPEGSRTLKFRSPPTIPSHDGKTTRNEGVPASVPGLSTR